MPTMTRQQIMKNVKTVIQFLVGNYCHGPEQFRITCGRGEILLYNFVMFIKYIVTVNVTICCNYYNENNNLII